MLPYFIEQDLPKQKEQKEQEEQKQKEGGILGKRKATRDVAAGIVISPNVVLENTDVSSMHCAPTLGTLSFVRFDSSS